MELKIFDVYNIRVRLSSALVLLAPAILTFFISFEDIQNIIVSALFISVIIAISNYIPILQRYCERESHEPNVAATFLYLNDKNLDDCTKKRYYRILASLDESFEYFKHPDDSMEFRRCCESAITWLRNNSRNNKLVQEENINYGFCKHLISMRTVGLLISFSLLFIVSINIIVQNPSSFNTCSNTEWLLFIINLFFFLFWLLGFPKDLIVPTQKKYAYALLGTLDIIFKKNDSTNYDL